RRLRPGELLIEDRREVGTVEPLGGSGVAGDRGPDATRVDAGDVHRATLRRHLHAQGLGELLDRGLGRVVGALRGYGHEREDAGEVDQVPVTGRDEVGQEL